MHGVRQVWQLGGSSRLGSRISWSCGIHSFTSGKLLDQFYFLRQIQIGGGILKCIIWFQWKKAEKKANQNFCIKMRKCGEALGVDVVKSQANQWIRHMLAPTDDYCVCAHQNPERCYRLLLVSHIFLFPVWALSFICNVYKYKLFKIDSSFLCFDFVLGVGRFL